MNVFVSIFFLRAKRPNNAYFSRVTNFSWCGVQQLFSSHFVTPSQLVDPFGPPMCQYRLFAAKGVTYDSGLDFQSTKTRKSHPMVTAPA